IAGKRWTDVQKTKIFESRIGTTKSLVSAIGNAGHPPKVLLNASAVGFYGNVPEGDVTESFSKGKGFLADLCAQWELEALRAEKFGVRVVLLRTGIVLDTDTGVFPKLLSSFRFFLGGHFGSGKQWFPWIHVLDEVNAILFTLENGKISGAVNLCVPGILRQKDFCTVLGRVLNRPPAISIPGMVLKILLGEMADPLLFQGQKVIPEKMIAAGFKFSFPECEDALKDLAG
ncbi:MAG: TIGR01777 family oxidoreductase, partial [Bacteroidota bacterium]